MLEITLTSAATTRLYSILREQEDDACVRVREFKVGTANSSIIKIELGLSIDERDAEDIEGEAHAIPFIMNRDLAEQYGTRFAVSLDDAYRAFAVTPVAPGNRAGLLPATEYEEKNFRRKRSTVS